jgi:hypothetical protein
MMHGWKGQQLMGMMSHASTVMMRVVIGVIESWLLSLMLM